MVYSVLGFNRKYIPEFLHTMNLEQRRTCRIHVRRPPPVGAEPSTKITVKLKSNVILLKFQFTR
jgi:hypothetical protein